MLVLFFLTCSKLEELVISYGPKKDYSAVKELHNLKNFIRRWADTENEIYEIIDALKECQNLKTVEFSNNNITSMKKFDELPDLTSLNLSSNKIEKIDKIGEILTKGGTINLDVDKLKLFTGYSQLVLSNQNLTTLEPLEGLTNLVSLNISNNPELTLEDEKSQNILKSMENLTTLNIYGCNITNIKCLNELKNLKTLLMNGNTNNANLKDIEDIISNLDALRVNTETLKTINNCDINKITKLNIPNSSLKELPDLSKFIYLTVLRLDSNAQIQNFEMISEIESLQNLNLSSNELHGRMIDFSKLTNLTNLNLSNNLLWSEDLEKLKA